MQVIRQNSHARELHIMKTATPPATGTANQAQKRSQPITVTITGELAERIRTGAKEAGFRADTWAKMCIKSGDLLTSPTAEASEFRAGIAISGNSSSNAGTVRISQDLVGLMGAILEASGTNMTVGEYVEKSIIGEVAESLQLKRFAEGVQDFIANEYALEPQDMPNMNRAAQDWASRNPEAADRIRVMNANR